MNRAYLKYVSGLLLFGTNGIVASYIALSSYEIVLLRTLIGCLPLLAVLIVRKSKVTFYRYRKQLVWLAVSGVAMGASWICLYEAYARIGVSISSLLYYCGPVIVVALSPLLFGERLDVFKMMGFVSVLCGIVFVNGNAFHGTTDMFGIVCGLTSAVMYSLMVIFNKKAECIKGLENAALQLFFAFVTVAVFVVLKQGIVISIPQSGIIPVIVLGVVNTGIGCYLYFSSIGHLPVQTVAICGYLEPLSAVMFSVLLLKEAMQPIQVIGAAMILGGAVFGECVDIAKKRWKSLPQEL